MPREKSRYREKRSDSYSSDSSYEKKKSKTKHKRRSRSRERQDSNSHRRKRSSSRSKHKRRSLSRSESRDNYESKSKRSTSHSKSKRRKRSISHNTDSRSSSRSRSKYSKNKKKTGRSHSSSSRSSSFDFEGPSHYKKDNLDDTKTKLEKAIKAAQAVGLTMTKIPTYEYKEVDIKEDMPTIQDRNLIAELNSDTFVQKAFTSSRSKKQSQNIVIDLNTQTVKVPESEVKVNKDDSIIDLDEIPSEADLKEMWIKKLYQYRKKMLRGEI